ncbi:MAG: large conductance mechanosensitive channel protein MscL [Christensenellales bacterium]
MKGFKDGFISFATRGNMIDLAVGMIIGSAFTAIVNSLVNDLLMPLLSPLTGKLDFSNLFVAMDGNDYATLTEATEAGVALLKYGNFITLTINFLIIALSIFIIISWIGKIRERAEAHEKKKKAQEAPSEEAAPTTKTCPYCITEIAIEATRCPNCTSVLDEA